MLHLYIHNQTSTNIDTKNWQNTLDRALLVLDIVNIIGDLEVILTNDEQIQSLNKQYRKKDKVTDVLSFPYIYHSPITSNKNIKLDNNNQDIIGQIFCSIPQIRRQSEENNTNFSKEMNKIFIHGILHILGFDHKNDIEYKEMSKYEEIIASS